MYLVIHFLDLSQYNEAYLFVLKKGTFYFYLSVITNVPASFSPIYKMLLQSLALKIIK